MKAKKADGNMVWVMVAIALALIFLLVYGVFISKGFGKGFLGIGNEIDDASDKDGDGVMAKFDDCEGTPSGEKVDLRGCSSSQKSNV